MRNLRIVLLTAAILAPVQSIAQIKCWLNKEEVRECGNVVPPQYVQEGHEEISDQGLILSTTRRAKTEKEIQQELSEQQRRKAIVAEQERAARDQRAYDEMLLDTFETEHDLFRARDNTLQVMQSNIELTRSSIERLYATRTKMYQEAARLERSGKPVTPSLHNDIETTQRQIREQREFIKSREGEQSALRAKFEVALGRFRELKQTSTP